MMFYSRALQKLGILYPGLIFFSDLFFSAYRAIIKKNTSGKVIVISLHKLGDTVLTIPAIKEIRKKHNKISIICFPEAIPIYKLAFENVDFITFYSNFFLFGDRIAKQVARKLLNQNNPYIIYDLTTIMGSATLLYNCKASYIIGSNRDIFKKIYTSFNIQSRETHLTGLYFSMIRNQIDVTDSSLRTEYPVSLPRGNKILIHPFAGWAAKEWNADKFVALAIKLSHLYPIKFVAHQPLSDSKLMDQLKLNGIEYQITKDIPQLIEVIKNESALFISNDTGPIHIASIIGSPTFSIYGPTNPSFTVPFGNYNRYVRKLVNCSPVNTEFCSREGGKTCNYFECMISLSVQDVLSELLPFLNEIDQLYKSEMAVPIPSS